jgi:hypothetical protein
MDNYKKLLKKAQMQQSILKIQALISDSVSKINSLIKKSEDKKEVILLSQISVNLVKVQRKLRQIENFLEKTTP